MPIDALTLIAWTVLAVLFLAVVAAVVYLGALPGSIARKRNHPQADAINAASWIGLALGGIGWPIAFVWAFLRQGSIGAPPDSAAEPSGPGTHDSGHVGGGEEPAGSPRATDVSTSFDESLLHISERLAAIEERLTSMEQKDKA